MVDTPRRRYSRSPSPRRRYVRSRSRSRSRSASQSRSPYRSRSPVRRDISSRDDVSNPGNNLYVTGLSARVVEADLEELFSQEGKVVDCRIVVDPRSRESRGFGFVTMDTLENAERCVKYLNRSTLEGRIITVEKAKRKRARTPTPGSYLGVRATVRPRSYGRHRDDPAFLKSIAQAQLAQAHTILAKVDALQKSPKGTQIIGLPKFRKRVKAELEFLQSVVGGKIGLQKSHVSCTNLGHLAAICDILELETNVVGVQTIFPLQLDENSKPERHEVDIVCRKGAMWIKVKAMKPETIQNLFYGNGSFGSKSIKDSVSQMVTCSKQHPFEFLPPTCVFWFVKGVTSDVAEDLQSMGIIVRGEQKDSDDEAEPETAKSKLIALAQAPGGATGTLNVPTLEPFKPQSINLVNIDITTLICYVSYVTNELDPGKNITFSDHILAHQAKEEINSPVLPVILKFLEGKELIVTKSAWEKFEGIINVVGGEGEQRRAKEFFKRLRVVDDHPSENAKQLKIGPKIKQQHIDIFGTGDYYKATTITANSAFVRIAADHGVKFNVFLHDARALTEQKIDNLKKEGTNK